MLEDFFDHRWFFDGGDDADPPLAGGTSLDVDAENSLRKPGPVHALFDSAVVRAVLGIIVFKRQLREGLGLGNDFSAVLVMRSQDTRISR